MTAPRRVPRRAPLPVTLRGAPSIPWIVSAGVAGHVAGPWSPAWLLAMLALCWCAALVPWHDDRGTGFSWGRMDGPAGTHSAHLPPQFPRKEAAPCT